MPKSYLAPAATDSGGAGAGGPVCTPRAASASSQDGGQVGNGGGEDMPAVRVKRR
jgi:hypothetical protein